MRAEAPHKLQMLGVEHVRQSNELKLLHVIRDHQPISRADLVKSTGLRAGTVSVVVNRLIRSEAIHEGLEAPSSGGRRATYLQINAEKAYVAGINIGVEHTNFGISDFNGKIISQGKIRTNSNAEKFLGSIADRIDAQMKSIGQRTALAGIGVSVPGLVDRSKGTLVRSPNLQWRDVPICSIFEKALKAPVYVENDANAAALAELWYGPLEIGSAHCMLFVLIVEGIGTGLVLDGEVYVGSRIGLGGFGHISMDPKGPVCSCGNVGCLEALASNRASVDHYNRQCKSKQQVESLPDLLSLAERENRIARKTIERTARIIGRGVKGLAQGLAPELIVFGGQITAAWALIEPVLKDEMQGAYLVPGVSLPQLRPASVRQPEFLGAFPVALRHVLHG